MATLYNVISLQNDLNYLKKIECKFEWLQHILLGANLGFEIKGGGGVAWGGHRVEKEVHVL